MNSERMHTDVGLGGPSIRWVWSRSLRRPLANTPGRFELPRGVKTACYCKQCTAVASTERVERREARWRRWACERGESGFEGHGIVMEKCAGVKGGKDGAMRTCHRRAKVGRRHDGGRRRCKVEGG